VVQCLHLTTYVFLNQWPQKCLGKIRFRNELASGLIQDDRPADPDPNEIFTNPDHNTSRKSTRISAGTVIKNDDIAYTSKIHRGVEIYLPGAPTGLASSDPFPQFSKRIPGLLVGSAVARDAGGATDVAVAGCCGVDILLAHNLSLLQQPSSGLLRKAPNRFCFCKTL
jgi:hypothetical protein